MIIWVGVNCPSRSSKSMIRSQIQDGHPAPEMAILIPGAAFCRGYLITVMRCRQTPCPEVGSRHRCTPSTARVRLPVSLCHIANSKNAREFNASHNQLQQVKLRTVNSHFATLPVRHWASGMYLRSHLQRFNGPLRHFCETYAGQIPRNRRPRHAVAQGHPFGQDRRSLPSCCGRTPSRISA